jgi:formate transporter
VPDVPTFDALLPGEMALRAEAVGQRKAELDAWSTFVLGVLAGAFIALGAIFSTTVGAGSQVVAFGVARLLVGLAFSLGLILVIVGGAELFTGNALIVMAWAGHKVSTRRLARNWLLVYCGNLVGSMATAVVAFVSGQYLFGAGSVGQNALAIGGAKTSLDPVQAVALGVLCNALVCLAVWLSFSARTTADRILAIIPPIAAFVAAGFEHSVANMYFIPEALLIKWYAPATFWASIDRSAADFPSLTPTAFLFANLIPVTIGNIVGGAGLVGIVYWFVYLRPRRADRGGT